MFEGGMVTDVSVWMREIGTSLGIIAAFIVAGKISIYVIDRFIRKLTEKTETLLDDMLLAVVEKPAFNLIVLWGAYLGFHRMSLGIAKGVFDILDGIVFVIAVAFFVKVVYDVINAVLEWYGIEAAKKGQEDIGRSVLPLVKKLVKIFAIISGIIVILDHFNYNISTLVAALGVSSLAIGLAAKETLSNMISGFAIAADRPFRIGDRIEVDNKVGDVIEVGLRSTKVKTIENNIIVIPNSKLVDNVVINYAYPENTTTYFLKLGVEYGSDPDRVKRAMLRAAALVPDVLSDPEPIVLFMDHGESNMMFHLMYRLPEYRLKLPAIDKLNMAVHKVFNEEGINFAFPTKVVILRGDVNAGARV